MKKTYNLSILNQKYTIKSDADEKHVKKVADYVNKKMNDIVSKNQAISTANVAVLAALNAADDLFKIKTEKNEKISKWIERVQLILDQMEQS